MGFDLSRLDRWSDEREFKVDAARTVAYAAAINDDHPRHVAGELAPPLFAVVPIVEPMSAAVTGIAPPGSLERIVHLGHDMVFHQPIVPGQLLRTRAAPIGVRVGGTGTTLSVKIETRSGDGALVNEQWATIFFRGVSGGDSGGEAAPAHKLTAAVKATAPLARVTYRIDEDQTFRYADASGDRMPIHLDADFARSVGLPGIIVHGLCTMAFTSRAVVTEAAAGDPTRLHRLAVRFSRPVVPGQEISTAFYDGGPADGRRQVGFETVNDAGEAVVKDGLAEVRT
jgi:acyl dehydratase